MTGSGEKGSKLAIESGILQQVEQLLSSTIDKDVIQGCKLVRSLALQRQGTTLSEAGIVQTTIDIIRYAAHHMPGLISEKQVSELIHFPFQVHPLLTETELGLCKQWPSFGKTTSIVKIPSWMPAWSRQFRFNFKPKPKHASRQPT